MRFLLVCSGAVILAGILVGVTGDVLAADGGEPSVNRTIWGTGGYISVPSARMARSGTVYAGVSRGSPFAHGFIGVQLGSILEVTARQTGKTQSPFKHPERLYPGVDLKIGLMEEGRFLPALALGVQSAVGHRVSAGEYLAASKRFGEFDVTAGIGWGRYGTAAHFENPLRSVSSHFDKRRDLSSEDPQEPRDWFTGKSAGVFAGVSYTPDWLPEIDFLLDFGADRYSFEQSAYPEQKRLGAWGAGINYRLTPWLSAAVGTSAGRTITGRLNVAYNLKDISHFKRTDYDVVPMAQRRPQQGSIAAIEKDVLTQGFLTSDIHREEPNTVHTEFLHRQGHSLPEEIGALAVLNANNAPKDIERFSFTPYIRNHRGPEVTLLRSDLERAYGQQNKTADELWRNTEIRAKVSEPSAERPNRFMEQAWNFRDISVDLENTLGLSEEDHGILYRSAFVFRHTKPALFGILDTTTSLKVNALQNFEKIREYRPAAILPVRSNVDAFAQRRLLLDQSFLSFTHSLSPSIHTGVAAGYLEEGYAGLGGEVLVRPLGSRLAAGAELWQVFKRDPDTSLAMGFSGDHVLSGHLNMWYDLPYQDLTLKASLGRFLAQDFGGQLSLQKTYDNGVSVEGFVSVSDYADLDLFGGTSHAYHGIRVSVPLGAPLHRNVTHSVKTEIVPIGRDTGQRLVSPLDLYETTTVFSYPHIRDNWDAVIRRDD